VAPGGSWRAARAAPLATRGGVVSLQLAAASGALVTVAPSPAAG
jgi:hypothetical protein